MRQLNGFLVVSANGDLRVTRRRPRLSWNEVGFPLIVRIPSVWGQIQLQSVTASFPEPEPVEAELGDVDVPKVQFVEVSE